MPKSLEAEHQPRTLRSKGLGVAVGEPQRISRSDEALITERVHFAESQAVRCARGDVSAELRRHEEELRGQLLKLRDPKIRPSRQSYRDLGQALVLIGKVRRALTPVS